MTYFQVTDLFFSFLGFIAHIPVLVWLVQMYFFRLELIIPLQISHCYGKFLILFHVYCL